MPKLKFQMTKQQYEEAEKGGNFTPPPAGVYRGRVIEITDETPPDKNRRLKIVWEISKGEHKGKRLYDYIVLTDSAEWRLHKFLTAVGLAKKVGANIKVKELNTDRPQDLAEASLRVKNETYNGQPTAKIADIFPLVDDEDEDDDDDIEAEGEDDAAEEEGEEEAEESDEEDEDDSEEEGDDDEEEEEVEDYNSWSVAELKEELTDRGLKNTGPKSALVKRLEEADAEDPFDE